MQSATQMASAAGPALSGSAAVRPLAPPLLPACRHLGSCRALDGRTWVKRQHLVASATQPPSHPGISHLASAYQTLVSRPGTHLHAFPTAAPANWTCLISASFGARCSMSCTMGTRSVVSLRRLLWMRWKSMCWEMPLHGADHTERRQPALSLCRQPGQQLTYQSERTKAFRPH